MEKERESGARVICFGSEAERARRWVEGGRGDVELEVVVVKGAKVVKFRPWRMRGMEGMGGISEKFVVMFWAVVPLVQRGEVLVVIGWDI